MNKFNQIMELLKTQYTIKYRFFLGLGVFSYIIILFLGLDVEILWSILKYFGFSQEMCIYLNPGLKIRDYIVIIGIMAAMFINIYVGTFFIISDYIGKKRDFFLLPYNISVKIISIFVYGFSWIIINVICAIGAFYLVTLGIENINLGILYFLNANWLYILISIGGAVLLMTQIIGFITIFTLIKTEKSWFVNLIIFWVLVLIFALFNEFVVKWFIIDYILKAALNNIQHDYIAIALREDYIPSIFSLGLLSSILVYISRNVGIKE